MLEQNEIKHIVISRCDSIGDVVLTLPMAGMLKKILPSVKISFLGKTYTKDVVALSEHVDEFINYDELMQRSSAKQIQDVQSRNIDCVIHVFPMQEVSVLMRKARVPLRVGTKNRLYHWFHCNKLIRLSRRNSDLHEAQLNLKLLEFLGDAKTYSHEQIIQAYGFSNVPPLQDDFENLLDKQRENVILHPKSKGSAREWGIENFSALIAALPADRYKIFISGTRAEGELCADLFKRHPGITDLTGKMSLSQFIAFIARADGLIAASTGPLHIASALGRKALGLFAPMRPIHPGRWMPLGYRADYLVLNKDCNACRKSAACLCIKQIAVHDVIRKFSQL